MYHIKKRSLFKRLKFELEKIFGIYWKGKFHKGFQGMRENKYLIIYDKDISKTSTNKEYEFCHIENEFIKRTNEILSLYGRNSIIYAGSIYFAYDYGIPMNEKQ